MSTRTHTHTSSAPPADLRLKNVPSSPFLPYTHSSLGSPGTPRTPVSPFLRSDHLYGDGSDDGSDDGSVLDLAHFLRSTGPPAERPANNASASGKGRPKSTQRKLIKRALGRNSSAGTSGLATGPATNGSGSARPITLSENVEQRIASNGKKYLHITSYAPTTTTTTTTSAPNTGRTSLNLTSPTLASRPDNLRPTKSIDLLETRRSNLSVISDRPASSSLYSERSLPLSNKRDQSGASKEKDKDWSKRWDPFKEHTREHPESGLQTPGGSMSTATATGSRASDTLALNLSGNSVLGPGLASMNSNSGSNRGSKRESQFGGMFSSLRERRSLRAQAVSNANSLHARVGVGGRTSGEIGLAGGERAAIGEEDRNVTRQERYTTPTSTISHGPGPLRSHPTLRSAATNTDDRDPPTARVLPTVPGPAHLHHPTPSPNMISLQEFLRSTPSYDGASKYGANTSNPTNQASHESHTASTVAELPAPQSTQRHTTRDFAGLAAGPNGNANGLSTIAQSPTTTTTTTTATAAAELPGSSPTKPHPHSNPPTTPGHSARSSVHLSASERRDRTRARKLRDLHAQSQPLPRGESQSVNHIASYAMTQSQSLSQAQGQEQSQSQRVGQGPLAGLSQHQHNDGQSHGQAQRSVPRQVQVQEQDRSSIDNAAIEPTTSPTADAGSFARITEAPHTVRTKTLTPQVPPVPAPLGPSPDFAEPIHKHIAADLRYATNPREATNPISTNSTSAGASTSPPRSGPNTLRTQTQAQMQTPPDSQLHSSDPDTSSPLSFKDRTPTSGPDRALRYSNFGPALELQPQLRDLANAPESGMVREKQKREYDEDQTPTQAQTETFATGLSERERSSLNLNLVSRDGPGVDYGGQEDQAHEIGEGGDSPTTTMPPLLHTHTRSTSSSNTLANSQRYTHNRDSMRDSIRDSSIRDSISNRLSINVPNSQSKYTAIFTNNNNNRASSPSPSRPLPPSPQPPPGKFLSAQDKQIQHLERENKRLQVRVEDSGRENRLLEAALMAVLKTSGKLNACPCGAGTGTGTGVGAGAGAATGTGTGIDAGAGAGAGAREGPSSSSSLPLDLANKTTNIPAANATPPSHADTEKEPRTDNYNALRQSMARRSRGSNSLLSPGSMSIDGGRPVSQSLLQSTSHGGSIERARSHESAAHGHANQRLSLGARLRGNAKALEEEAAVLREVGGMERLSYVSAVNSDGGDSGGWRSGSRDRESYAEGGGRSALDVYLATRARGGGIVSVGGGGGGGGATTATATAVGGVR